MGNNWRVWLQQYVWFEIATQMVALPANVQVATFMASIGSEAFAIFIMFSLTASEHSDINTINTRFQNYFIPQVNTTY